MRKSPAAEIVAVGTELLGPDRPESNSLFLAGQLLALGVEVVRKVVVGDVLASIQAAVSQSLEAGRDILLLTGGLGPTNDDVTRQAVAAALQRPLELDEDLLRGLQRRYRQAGLPMSANNRRQALVIRGAQVLPNPNGTAPGLFLKVGSSLIFLLPGPPRELQPMFRHSVLPLLRTHLQVRPRPQRHLRVASEAESRVDARIQSLYQRRPQIQTTILSSPGLIDLYFTWRGEEGTDAQGELARLVEGVRKRLGRSVFAEGEASLEEVTGELLLAKSCQLAVAESCTGGWVCKLLTDVPGSSQYFLGGVVGYADRLKVKLLGVRASTLHRYGAVSRQVAREMAQGILKQTGADLGLALTGIAGPGGGSEEKPVGLVYIALAAPTGSRVRRLQLPGDRETIRLRASRIALDLVRRSLLDP